MSANFETTYGADQNGLIWGYHFKPGQPALLLDSSQALSFIQTPEHERSGEFLWLHFSLSHASATPWLRKHCALPDEYYETMQEAASEPGCRRRHADRRHQRRSVRFHAGLLINRQHQHRRGQVPFHQCPAEAASLIDHFARRSARTPHSDPLPNFWLICCRFRPKCLLKSCGYPHSGLTGSKTSCYPTG